jgi:hypothetical protein
MKGKTGKPAMRGGGMARKGTGMALKGGGIARKGTGSNSDPAGKTKKMFMGGTPGPRDGGFAGAGAGRLESPGQRGSMGAANRDREGGRGQMRRDERAGQRNDMVRPGFPQRDSGYGSGPIRPKTVTGGGKGGPGSGQTMPQGADPRMAQALAAFANTTGYQQSIPGVKKDGGKVSKYAKGGAVKMTAGAGSGSGRLEKAAAHKAAKRIPAANLKSGGKVKGK